jgi:hypothetical protein
VIGQQDVTPPKLTAFGFLPTTINTATGPQSVMVNFSVTDDISGVRYVQVEFVSPSGSQVQATGNLSFSSTSVTSSANVAFPQFSETGTWKADLVYLQDVVGNTRILRTADLAQMGFPTDLIVVGDNIPPTTSANASPSPNINGWNNTNVTINLSATDNPSGSGVKQIQLALGGSQNTGWQTVAGNAASVTISSEGTTILSYFATDNAGNQETVKTLTVRIDKTPPVIVGLPTTGCTIWPPNHKMVQVATVTAADALSGLDPGSFKVTGASSDPVDGQIVITGGPNQFNVQIGADKDEVYTLTATASDLAGNIATQQATCSVPHDQGK